MTPSDWFALAIRVFGTMQLVSGLATLLDALLFRLGYFHYLDSSPRYYVVTGLFLVIIGIYLLRGAGTIVAFAYPNGEYAQAIANEEDSKEVERD